MVDLKSYDVILVNSSGGKDSQVQLDVIAEQCREAGIMDRLVVVHCDLGRVEWEGTRELAQEQAAHYGVRFEVVSRPQGDLLTHIEKREMFPGPSTRYCTSDHKRGQVRRLMTQLTDEVRSRLYARGIERQVRILNCMGLRADESSARAKLEAFSFDAGASNGRRHVDTFLPIHAWTAEQVWARIKQSGVRHHRAYDLGMPRLTCCFCIYAPKAALMLAGEHNRKLLDEYVRVEEKIGHTFTVKQSLKSLRDDLDAGKRANPAELQSWTM